MNQHSQHSMDDIDHQKVEEMLGDAGKSLGKNPADLVGKVKDGKIDEVIQSLPPDKAQLLTEALNDPQKAQELLNTPQAKMLMKLFFKNGTP